MIHLDTIAELASVVTAVVAAYGYCYYRWTLHRRTRALEEILATKNQPRDDSLTVEQLAIAICATKEQVIEAAARSKTVRSHPGLSGNENRFTLSKKPD